jgi:sugar lactone lactonase YvrE
MLHFPSWFRTRERSRPRRSRSYRPTLEALEDRLVPIGVGWTIDTDPNPIAEIGDVSAFVASGSGGLNSPRDLVLGPDGNTYVASSGSNSVLRYMPTGQLLGTFVAAGSGGLSSPFGLAFGPDGNLYVGSEGTNTVYEYSGSTGAFLNTFVSAGSGGLNDPKGLIFGQDGNLYVSSHTSGSVLRYEGPKGAVPGTPLPASGQSGATFVPAGSGSLDGPKELIFGPDGSLYVSSGVTFFAVLRFDAATGNFLGTYVASGVGGLQNPTGLAFDQDGRLYVADLTTNAIHRFDSQGNYLDDAVIGSASSLRAPVGLLFDAQGGLLVSSRDGNSVGRYDRGVTVNLSAPSSMPVTVNYATMDGTATAPGDYTAESGTVTFSPGQTSRLILVVTHYESAADGNETFSVVLSNPSNGATIVTATTIMTIVDPNHTSISGTIFNDLNGNGVYEAGEPGLAGWKVWLDDDRDGIFNNNEPYTITNASGIYFLDTTNQALGTGPASLYYLAFSLPDGSGGRWVPTTPVFAADDPSTEPNAVRNFGVKFQPYGSTGPAGSETAVNANTTESVSTTRPNVANAVSADANGDYVVAWQTPQSGSSGAVNVSARVFNANGTPLTGELAVGTGSTGSGVPSVAMAGNGQFVVAWQNGSSTISMAIYQLNGTFISKSNTISSNWLQGIAADSVGNFAVLYGGKADRWTVEQPTVQRYTKTGAVNGNGISIATPRLVGYNSGIGMDGNGNFTVSWDDVNNGAFVYFQRYTSAGKPTGSQVTVAQSSPALHSLVMNSAGQFVVTWSVGSVAYAQVYTSAGSPSGSQVTLPNSAAITTAIDSGGNVTFAWSAETSALSSGQYLYNVGNVHYLQLLASGQLTPESVANTTTQGYHAVAGVAATGKGMFVIAWVGNGAGDPFGIELQRFAGGPQIGSFTSSASAVTGGNPLTLSASNFTDPNAGATITQVAFYATDSTGNQYLLGYGTNTGGVWSLTITVTLVPGSYKLFAEATDSNAILGGDSAFLSLTVS